MMQMLTNFLLPNTKCPSNDTDVSSFEDALQKNKALHNSFAQQSLESNPTAFKTITSIKNAFHTASWYIEHNPTNTSRVIQATTTAALFALAPFSALTNAITAVCGGALASSPLASFTTNFFTRTPTFTKDYTKVFNTLVNKTFEHLKATGFTSFPDECFDHVKDEVDRVFMDAVMKKIEAYIQSAPLPKTAIREIKKGNKQVGYLILTEHYPPKQIATSPLLKGIVQKCTKLWLEYNGPELISWALFGRLRLFNQCPFMDGELMLAATQRGIPTAALDSEEDRSRAIAALSGCIFKREIRHLTRGEGLKLALIPVAAQYLTGNFQPLIDDFKKMVPEDLHAPALYDRNRKWVEKITPDLEEANQTNTSICVAGGTAHFVGTNSVVELLQKRGYTIEESKIA